MRRGLFLLVLIAIVSGVFASYGDVISAINRAYQKGEITLDEAALYKAYAIVAPERLPQRFQGLPAPKSGTPALVEIFQQQAQLSQQTRTLLRTLLSRPTGLPLTYDTDHFRMHYTLSGGDAVPNEDYVHQMANRFEAAYNFLVDTRDYLAPPSDGTAGGNSKYDVYIMDIPGGGVLGYTSPETEGSYPWNDATSYIVMRNDYSAYTYDVMGLIDVTSVHEFFHAVQMAYSYNQPTWYMEVSSVWIEDELYPDNDEEHEYLPEFFNYPYISITTEPSDPSHGLHCYSSYIFNQYLSEAHGDSIVRLIWEANRYTNVLTSLQNVLSGFGSSRSDAFAEFFLWNYFTGSRNIPGHYPEGADFPTIQIERTHSTYPADGSPSHRPEALASNYIVFNIPAGASGPFSVTFDGADGTNWIVQLVIPEGTSYTVHTIPLNPYGYGSYSVPESEYSGHSEIVMIVGNVSTSGGGADYSYHADFEEIGPSYDPPRNLVAESGHSGEVPLHWDPPIGGGVGGTTELSHDDGTPMYYLPWDLTSYGVGHVDIEAVKFNASSACTLKQIKVYFNADGNVTFHIYQDNSGSPGDDFPGSPFTASVTGGDWCTIDVPGGGIPLPVGDFWIGYERTGDELYCYMDADTSSPNPNLFHTDDGNWYMGIADYMIRAVVTSPSTGVTVTGYTVYRSTTMGGPYSPIGTSATESYTDASVVDGTAYYYVVTANYSDGGESGYSNEAMAVPGASAGGEYDTLTYVSGMPTHRTAGLNWGWQCAVVFEPEEPCKLVALRYLVIPDSGCGTGVFGVGMYRWTGIRIAGPLFEPFVWVFNPGSDGWTEIDMEDLNLYFSSGFAASFVVYDTCTRLGMVNEDDDYSYFYSYDDSTWFGSDYKFYIQAVVRYLESGETHTLSGVVNLSPGTGGSPPPTDLSGSVVRIVETGDADTTGPDGSYSFELSSGVYTVEAWHMGYVPQTAVIGIEESDVVQNFALIPFNTPLNPVRNLRAFSYLDSEVFLMWDPPLGYPGTQEKIYYFNPATETPWYVDSLDAGSIFDTRFEVWFPCTLKTAGIVFYSSGSYPDVSVHIWADDGTGYPDVNTDLIDSMVISPVPDSAGYARWTEIDLSDAGLVIYPGQKIHLGVRLLGSHLPSVVADDDEPGTSPPVSRYYSHRMSLWQDWGEALEYIEVSYGEGGMLRLAPTPVADRSSPIRIDYALADPHRGFVRAVPTLPEVPSRALVDVVTPALMSPLEVEGLTEYWVYRADSPTGPFDYVGSVPSDSFAFVDSGVTNGVLHYYYVVASYDYGYSEAYDTAVALPLAWNEGAWVLFVDDDGSNFVTLNDGSFAPDEGIAMAQILLDIGVPFNAVELPPNTYISAEDLSGYQAVLWDCGIGYTGGWTLSDSEQTNIAAYLDGGGEFALFGQDFLWDVYSGASSFGVGQFAYDYLGVSGANQDAWTITGDTTGSVVGYGVADGLEFGITNPYQNWVLYPDYLLSFEGDTLLTLLVGGVGGAVAVTYEGDGFKTAFSTLSPLALVDGASPNTKEEFIRRLLYDYFNVHEPGLREISFDLEPGWHLLSIPVQPAENTTDVVFPGNLMVLTYDPAADSFFVPDEIEPGRGYFVLYDSPASFTVTGHPVDTVTVDLHYLWNLVGVPYSATGYFALDQMNFEPNYFVAHSVFGYDTEDDAYYPAGELEVGRGYWVAVLGDCEMRLPGGGRLVAAKSGVNFVPPALPAKPEKVKLISVAPNPFNSACEIDVPAGAEVEIYSPAGRLVERLSADLTEKSGGKIVWRPGEDVPSGVYVIRAVFGSRATEQKIMYLK
ncbi:hypothetical protein J7K99_07580 [bacterium]|nr:hypothetical protein [bacterium]